MIDIMLMRELHCYRKMYHVLFKTINGCVDVCKDLVVREKLIKAMQDAEDIYTGEEYEGKVLTADERIIVELLSFIMDTEISRVTDADMQIVDDCVQWSLTIQDKKIEYSEEEARAKINRILEMAGMKKDSEQ